MSRYDTFQWANNNGADQTALMHRLVCAFVVRKPPKRSFLASKPKFERNKNRLSKKYGYQIRPLDICVQFKVDVHISQ